MPSFDAIYKQTVTLFNRVDYDGTVLWYPTVLENVHLVVDRSIIISTYGEQAQDNAKLHIRYAPSSGGPVIGSKVYMQPKEFQRIGVPGKNITFAFGDEFDFFIEGLYDTDPINDDDYPKGFFNYMNKTYDNVFSITNVSKFNLIPHFEITAR